MTDVPAELDQAAITTRLDPQQKLLRALARTQSDHTAQFRDHGERLDRMDNRLDRVEAGIGRLEVGVRAILGLLGGAEGSTGGPGTSVP